ncbi:MAG TPA: restriction endonuclease subunit S [Isosphaeraceae bacterium]|nr:restriction endonuclease subunit S [Isosphaeraceae bacterium]
MKNGWNTRPLGDVAAIAAGNSAPQDEALFKDGTIPFFRTSDAGRIRFGDIYEAKDYLNARGAGDLRLFPKGTILFPKSGASTFLNHRVMLGVSGCVSSHLATIFADETQADPRFLLYFLSTVRSQDLVQDHAYPSLSLTAISEIQIHLPSVTEQQRIVSILDQAFESIATAKANAEKNLQNARALFESQLQSIFSQRSDGWVEKPFGDCIDDVKYPVKVQRRDFLPVGEYPIISQETEFINGHWDRAADVFRVTTPVVIFGDHTRVLKYIDFDFVLGADGVKILRPKPFLIPKFFYFQLRGLSLKPLGYARHYRLLREVQIAFPDSAAQQKIGDELEGLAAETQRLESIYQRKLTALDDLKKSLLHQAFSGNL